MHIDVSPASLIDHLLQWAAGVGIDMCRAIKLIADVVGRAVIALALMSFCLSPRAAPYTGQSGASLAHEETHSLPGSFVKMAIKEINDAPFREMKIQRAQDLGQWVARHSNDVSAADVDSLAALLSSEDDTVRLWIAGALGQLRDKAKAAVPQLQRALLERPCANVPATSAAAIRLALLRIGAQPINAPCTDSFEVPPEAIR